MLDVSVGIIATILLADGMGIPLKWWYVVIGATLSIIIDISIIKKSLHYPSTILLVIVPSAYFVGFMTMWWLGIDRLSEHFRHLTYFVLLAEICLFAHFVHDSFGVGWGVKWLYPLSQKSFKLFCTKENEYEGDRVLIWWTEEELKVAIKKYGDPDWMSKYCMSPLFIIDILFCCGAIAMIVLRFFIFRL